MFDDKLNLIAVLDNIEWIDFDADSSDGIFAVHDTVKNAKVFIDIRGNTVLK